MMFLLSFRSAPDDIGRDLIPSAKIQFDGGIWSQLVIVIGDDTLLGHGSLEATIAYSAPGEFSIARLWCVDQLKSGLFSDIFAYM